MIFRTVLVASALALAPAIAFGQAEYNASDVLEHFSKTEEAEANACPAGTPCLRKKKTRAVCIGTDSACAAEEVAAAPAAKGGFDLLITFDPNDIDIGTQTSTVVALSNKSPEAESN